MAGIDYASLAAFAQQLIDDSGAPITISRFNKTPADPAKPWRGGGTDVPVSDIVVKGVIIPNDELDDKESMRRGDATAYVSANSFGSANDIVGYDLVVDSENVQWHLHGVKLLNPGGVRLLFELVLEH